VTAGAAAAQLAEWARNGRVRALGASACGLAVLAALTLLPLAPDEGRAKRAHGENCPLDRGGPCRGGARLLPRRSRRTRARLLFYRVAAPSRTGGDFGEAIAFFEKAVQASPGGGRAGGSPEPGQALAAAGRPAEAIPHFAAARDAGVSPALAGL